LKNLSICNLCTSQQVCEWRSTSSLAIVRAARHRQNQHNPCCGSPDILTERVQLYGARGMDLSCSSSYFVEKKKLSSF